MGNRKSNHCILAVINQILITINSAHFCLPNCNLTQTDLPLPTPRSSDTKMFPNRRNNPGEFFFSPGYGAEVVPPALLGVLSICYTSPSGKVIRAGPCPVQSLLPRGSSHRAAPCPHQPGGPRGCSHLPSSHQMRGSPRFVVSAPSPLTKIGGVGFAPAI